MKDKVKRISIIGGAGTGKTTLANNLGKVLKLPVYHIDGINYFKDWEQRDKEERDNIILKKIEEDSWVIDGTYTTTLEKRLEKSDLVIFMDYSTFYLLKGVTERFFKHKGRERAEIPGCKEKLSIKFIFWVLKWRKNKRKKILEEIKKVDNKKVLIFNNRKKLNKWFENIFNTKIEIKY